MNTNARIMSEYKNSRKRVKVQRVAKTRYLIVDTDPYMFDDRFAFYLKDMIYNEWYLLNHDYEKLRLLTEMMYYIHDCIPKLIEFNITKYITTIKRLCQKCEHFMEKLSGARYQTSVCKPYAKLLTKSIDELRPAIRTYCEFVKTTSNNDDHKAIATELLANM